MHLFQDKAHQDVSTNYSLRLAWDYVHPTTQSVSDMIHPIVYWLKYLLINPRNGLLDPKNLGKGPDNIEIRPKLTYSVSRGYVTGLAVPKVPLVFKHF